MEKSFGLFFHLKKNKKSEKDALTIYMRLTVDGVFCEISTKRKCPVDKWDVRGGRMIGKSEGVNDFNRYLDTLRQKVFEAKRKLIELDKPVTAEVLKQMLTGHETEKKYMVMEIFRQHNEQMKALEGKEFAAGTVERYETSFRHTQEFLRWKYKVADLELKTLTKILSQIIFSGLNPNAAATIIRPLSTSEIYGRSSIPACAGHGMLKTLL